MMRLLILESTCDETAAAVVDGDRKVLGAVVASQDALHERFQGVVPEIAARAHVERILPVIDEALRRAGTSIHEIDGVAVAHTPGLAGSLLVGVVAAKTLAWGLGVPLVAINHLHAHVYACQMAVPDRRVFPCIGFVVSGGHTSLYRCTDPLSFELLGGTIDDAAGEAFDKVANMLGLPFPGGPALARMAELGDPTAFAFPRAMMHDQDGLRFSFSGLKTAVRYAIAGPGKVDFTQLQLDETLRANVAASFQAAVVDCLVAKARQSLRHSGLKTLCVGGGVAANRRFRAALEKAARDDRFELHIAPTQLCTDNAVMGALALELMHAEKFAPLDLDVKPGLER
jgi:N6-L-threonylcarbamoyladenine synthase